MSRTKRWGDACERAKMALEDLEEIRQEYEEWRDNLPENFLCSPLGEKLEEICEIDIEDVISQIDDFQNMDLPLGFGRD